MGYTTEFYGQIEINPPLSQELIEYINMFGNTRRIKRNVNLLKNKYGNKHGFNGNYGTEGEYFVFDDGNYGQSNDIGVIDGNCPPSTQPGLWCQWMITDDGKYIEWDTSEKFYEADEWMEYIIDNFISENHTCNGVIEAQGEDSDDRWKLVVTNNNVSTRHGSFVWDDEEI